MKKYISVKIFSLYLLMVRVRGRGLRRLPRAFFQPEPCRQTALDLIIFVCIVFVCVLLRVFLHELVCLCISSCKYLSPRHYPPPADWDGGLSLSSTQVSNIAWAPCGTQANVQDLGGAQVECETSTDLRLSVRLLWNWWWTWDYNLSSIEVSDSIWTPQSQSPRLCLSLTLHSGYSLKPNLSSIEVSDSSWAP